MDQQSQEEVKAQYDAVCSELNLDEEAKESAWESYQLIYNDYVLEGSQIEWLACALYVACRSSSTQTVEGDEYSGNSISLTQILRVTKLKLIEFFRKVKKWVDMVKLPPFYLEKVEALERKFEVISVIFKKYELQFSTIFQLQDTADKQTTPSKGGGGNSRPRSRKPNKAKPCSVEQLFQFGWVLYVHIKNQFPLINDDLVNSHYLLLCCLDMLSGAAVLSKRRDLVNLNFPGLTAALSPSLLAEEFTGILPELCRQTAAIERECQVVHDYYWWPSVRRLYESQTLTGVPAGPDCSPELNDVLASLLQPASFQSNFRSLKTAYELVMLEEGDFDERVFLNGQSELENYSQQQQGVGSSEKERIQPGVVYQSPQHLQYGTPLTGREYLSSRENKLTPVSDANQSVIQLHLLLEDCLPGPSESLIKICSLCLVDPLKNIALRLEEMGKVFLSSFKADSFESPDNFALLRLQLSQSLYYKLLSAIVKEEESKLKHVISQNRYSSIQLMLEHDHFHKSLFALCIEIVLFSYNSHSRIFPWVLGVIDINSYHFYKVIEIIIKVEPGFPRGIVKHLSKIEELVLSSLAWKSSSPLYDSIDSAPSIPRYEEVALPNASAILATPTPMSPLQRLRASKEPVASPLSARDRYSSPHPASSRRQLFTGKRPPPPKPLSSPMKIAPKPPQGVVQVTQLKPTYLQEAAAAITSLLQQQRQSMLSPQKTTPILPAGNPSSDANNLTIQALVTMANMKSPLASPDRSSSTSSSSLPTITLTVSPSQSKTPQKQTTIPTIATPTSELTGANSKPRRTGSVALFYRKVYQMSFLRIKDLCERLQLDVDTIQKIWTCFEYCLVNSPDVMKERNIDQLIMCSIYIVAKVLRKDITFQEIMRQYRHQPQAKSHVYRSVLLNNGCRQRKSHSHTVQEGSDQPQVEPNSCANEEEGPPLNSRGDIIQFYNKVFINLVKDFVLRFTPGDDLNQSKDIPLSPLPVIKRTAVSPRKLSKSHQIFISPLKGLQPSLSPLAKTFVVNKSPASDFQELNDVIGAGNRTTCKRKLDTLLSCSPGVQSPAKRPYISERNRSLAAVHVGRPQGHLLHQRLPHSAMRISTNGSVSHNLN